MTFPVVLQGIEGRKHGAVQGGRVSTTTILEPTAARHQCGRAHRAFGFTLAEYIKQHTINEVAAHAIARQKFEGAIASSSLKACPRWVVFYAKNDEGCLRWSRSSDSRPLTPSAASGKQ